MRVLLFTLTGFGNKVLDALLDNSCEVKYLFTRKKTGPFRFYKEEDIKKYAGKKGIEVYDEFEWAEVEKIIKQWKPNLLLVASFHRIIPERIISLVPLRVNLHSSLLPKYRGPNPIQWSLYNREKEIGVTAHSLVKEVDAGDILVQKRITIKASDNENILMKKLAVLAGEITINLINQIKKDSLKPKRQNVKKITYFPNFKKFKDENSVIAVMGGSLKRGHGRQWRTANYNEGDDFCITGDRSRVLAASCFYKKNSNNKIIALGGTGQYKNIPGIIPVAKVIKQELILLGVPPSNIVAETHSENTFQQLRGLGKIIRKERIKRVTIISNRYHLPRIRAMINFSVELKKLFTNIKVELISAEEILIKSNSAAWEKTIRAAYKSRKMKERIELEKRGVQQIKAGIYNLK